MELGRAKFFRDFTAVKGLSSMLGIQNLYTLYEGSSMRSTFVPGDLLWGIPRLQKTGTLHPNFSPPKIGDVLLFYDKTRKKNIVHRLVSIQGQTYVTKGDNNLGPECELITLHDVIALVKARNRQGVTSGIFLGKWGQLIFYYTRLKTTLKVKLKIVLYPFYNLCAYFSPFKLLFKLLFHPTLLQLPEGKANSYILVHKKTILAHKENSESPWIIVAPYRLFLDKQSLDALSRKSEICAHTLPVEQALQ